MKSAVWVVLAFASAAAADVVVLDDNTRLEGVAKRAGDDWVIVDAAGRSTASPPAACGRSS